MSSPPAASVEGFTATFPPLADLKEVSMCSQSQLQFCRRKMLCKSSLKFCVSHH